MKLDSEIQGILDTIKSIQPKYLAIALAIIAGGSLIKDHEQSSLISQLKTSISQQQNVISDLMGH